MEFDVYKALFEQAKINPDTTAILSDNEQLSYADFLKKIGGYQTILKKSSVQKVAIYLPASADAFAVMYAALSLGVEYTPINIDAPYGRIKSIIESYQPDLLIKQDVDNKSLLDDFQLITQVCSSDFTKREPDQPLIYQGHLKAYTIFTSGSTGVPKGVMILRESLNAYIEWVQLAIPVKPSERWSQHPNIAFDLSVLDIFGALTQSATLVVATTSMDRLFPAKYIQKYQINIWNSVPSVFSLIDRSKHLTNDFLSSLRFITFCGEPLSTSLLKKIIQSLPSITVQNTYGPTEATVSCTAVSFDKDSIIDDSFETVTLGDAIRGVELLINTESENSNKGELLVVGDQVALGYAGDDNQTQLKFSVCLNTQGKEKRVFKTGDVVERVNEQLYFVARLDDVYKINGHFVNLAGIEVIISKILNMSLVCTIWQNKIHVFVTEQALYDVTTLRQKSGDYLMPYELPVAIHLIDEIPLSINDKIDRNYLNQRFYES